MREGGRTRNDGRTRKDGRTSVLIFDLDGTLVDSKPDLLRSVNHVRQRHDLPGLGEDAITAMIGDGAEMLVRRALGHPTSEARVREGLELFLAYYREHMLDESVLYPGVVDTLDELTGWTLAVLTNKPVRFTCRMLEGLGVYDRFAAVYGGNSFPDKKPDPVGIRRILSDTGGDPTSTWMVGDSSVDVLTGRRAGVRTCGVTYGYASHTFEAHPPDARIDRFPDLTSVI